MDCRIVKLENGLGDYYQGLLDRYLGNKLESQDEQESFILELNKLLLSDIEFSDKMSILNALASGIEGHDIWRLFRAIE